MVGSQLLAILNLGEDRDDGDASLAIVGLVTSALHDESPAYTLKQIFGLVATNGGGTLLDPLNLLPVLLPICAGHGKEGETAAAKDLLALMGECANPREVVVAVQEGVEKVRRGVSEDVDADIDEDEEEGDDSDQEGEEGDKIMAGKAKRSKWIGQALVLVELYSAAIPRLKLRRNKSLSETIGPLMEELGGMICSVAVSVSGGGDEVLEGVKELVRKVRGWVNLNVGEEGEKDEKDKCYTSLRNLLETTVEACVSNPSTRPGTGKAQRTFQGLFPRMRVPVLTSGSNVNAAEEEQKGWEAVMSGVVEEHTVLSEGLPGTGTPSRASLILLAYSDTKSTFDGDLTRLEKALEGYMPTIIASIQTNLALEETLSVLLTSFHRFCYPATTGLTHVGRREVSPQITIPLTTILPVLASTHPDGDLRYVTFRVLGMVVRCVGPVNVRMEVLMELVGGNGGAGGVGSEEEEEEMIPPGMRVAAVGLVKEILLESLAMADPNLMASPMFLKVFGPVLFKHRLVELSAGLTGGGGQGLKELVEKMGEEPARVTECLLLLYVLILRDAGNKTGIRDRDNVKNLQREFLNPLKGVLEKWESLVPDEIGGPGPGLGGSSHSHDHDDEEQKIMLTIVVPLKLAVERADYAISSIGAA